MRYWLDANIFITAKNTVYAFEINSTLWAWMDRRFSEKSIAVPARVYREIMDYKKDDLLKQWAVNRKHLGMCTEPDKNVWKSYSKIGELLYSAQLPQTATFKRAGRRYSDAQIKEFDRGADAMVIAHALADGGAVVTFETDLKPASRKIRIPDICNQLEVPCMSLKELLMTFAEKL